MNERRPQGGARTARLPGGTLRPTGSHTLSGCGVSGKRGFPRGLCPAVVVIPPPFLRDWRRGSGRGPQARHVCCVLSTLAPLPPTASSKGKRSEGGLAHIVRGLRGPALESTLPPNRASPPQDSLGLPPQGPVGEGPMGNGCTIRLPHPTQCASGQRVRTPTDWIVPGYPIRNRPGWGRRIGLGTPPPTNHQRKGEEKERETPAMNRQSSSWCVRLKMYPEKKKECW